MINNEVRDTEGRVIGFRCSVCDGVKTKMWDTICNECRAKYSAGKPEEQPEPGKALTEEQVTENSRIALWQAKAILKHYVRSIDAIYNHDESARRAVVQHFGTIHPAHVWMLLGVDPNQREMGLNVSVLESDAAMQSWLKESDSVSDGGSEPATSVSSPESAAVSLSAGVKEQEEWTNLGAIVCLGSTALFGCESEDHAKGATSAHNSSVAALRERITQLESLIPDELRPCVNLEEKDAKDQR